MRTAALSVWIFINLVCFGMCGYLYLIWSQYWMYLEKQKYFNRATTEESPKAAYHETYTSAKYVQSLQNYFSSSNDTTTPVNRFNRRSAIGAVLSKSESHNHSSNSIVKKMNGGPRFPNTHKTVLELDTNKYVCLNISELHCESKTKDFKDLLLKEFYRVLMSDSNVFKSGLESQNTYNVKYEYPEKRLGRNRKEIMCALKKISMRTVTSKDEPFTSEGFRIPNITVLRSNQTFNTCAVITSAGALLGSHLGKFIDTHDMILRFNNAPTNNYTEDVGSKTTFRVLNSQVVTKSVYNFLQNPLFNSTSILIWDPANFSSSLEEWYHHPDFPLFPVYKRLLDRKPNADVHILRPEVLWELWSVLQDSSPYRLRRNPPSSGFIGIWFALHRCNYVRVFEYVPSTHATRRCHYNSAHFDIDCTLGAWHPLAQEKALAEKMRVNSDIEVFQKGYIGIPGFSKTDC